MQGLRVAATDKRAKRLSLPKEETEDESSGYVVGTEKGEVCSLARKPELPARADKLYALQEMCKMNQSRSEASKECSLHCPRDDSHCFYSIAFARR